MAHHDWASISMALLTVVWIVQILRAGIEHNCHFSYPFHSLQFTSKELAIGGFMHAMDHTIDHIFRCYPRKDNPLKDEVDISSGLSSSYEYT